MKALTLTAYNQLELLELPRPDIAEDEVLVKVAACGICGSDIHGADGSSGRRIPPIVMGHEAAGTIEEIGSRVTQWALGQRVAFDSMLFCGQCDVCKQGHTNLCPERRVIGVSCEDYRRDGAFAELVAIPSRMLVPIPDGLRFEHAAFGEPVAVAMHAVNQIGLRGGESALVVGAGLIGLLVIQALRINGAQRIFASDCDAHRLELARQLGADEGWEPEATYQKTREATDGKGVDVVMEVVGKEPTVHQSIRCVRSGGKIGCVGNLAPSLQVPWQEIVTRELTLFGSCGSSGEYAGALDAIASGAMQVAPLISAVGKLEEGNHWFARLQKNDEGLMKVILQP